MFLLSLGRCLSAIAAVSSSLAMSIATASPTDAAGAVAAPPAVEIPTTIEPHEWSAFASRYIAPDGRVVDIEKSGMTHSEGQSYGMLLAVSADDQATFDRVLGFTFHNMRARNDNLVSWSYDPHTAAVTDRNNASDGDILIAYALLGAAAKWREPRYAALAEPMIDDIGRLLLHDADGLVLLRPGAFGFDRGAHRDGPVVNLSYYVYGALLAFAKVDDRHPFFKAWQSGLMLTEHAVAVSGGYAPDWITMREDRPAQPAHGFAKKSSYDAVRIPLYMMLGGQVPPRYLAPFDRAWNVHGNLAPTDFDLETGRKLGEMGDNGYRTIAALTACAVRGMPIPARLQRFRTTTYFNSALHLMALSAARAHYPHCVEDAPRSAPTITASASRPATILVGSRQPAAAGLGNVPLPPAPGTYGAAAPLHFSMR